MKSEDYRQRVVDFNGWQVNLTSYRFGDAFLCKADNVSPGAWLARSSGATREEAEKQALQRAQELLSRTLRRAV